MKKRSVFRNTYLADYWVDFLQIWYVGRVTYIKGIKYVNMIEISLVVIEI